MNATSIIFLVLTLAIVIVTIASLWKVFAKAGESGWKALIPIYNNYIMLQIAGHSGWWVLLLLLPVLPILIAYLAIDPTALVQQMDAASSGAINLIANSFFVSIQIMWIVLTVMLYDLCRSFGRGLGFTIGATMLPFIFWPILGFGEAQYRGPVAHPKMVASGTGAHVEDGSKNKTESHS